MKRVVKKPLKFVQEFKTFATRSNVMDLAIAVIVGAAFNAIITSFVGDIFTPLLSIFTGGMSFNDLVVWLGPEEGGAYIAYGKFIQALINFLIISFAVFLLVKAINLLLSKKLAQDVPKMTCPYCASEIPAAAVRCPLCTTVLDESAIPARLI
jgi:large conductance mechanosensitive channel